MLRFKRGWTEKGRSPGGCVRCGAAEAVMGGTRCKQRTRADKGKAELLEREQDQLLWKKSGVRRERVRLFLKMWGVKEGGAPEDVLSVTVAVLW